MDDTVFYGSIVAVTICVLVFVYIVVLVGMKMNEGKSD